ncbi:MAG TPA: septal ring lytic transglycosylase RlpA family protein [Methyloceanibacter sp.]|nr:septal ring lytic transglycosylase RlpA family protein [Methyloceanibacter sp.]
MRAFAAPVLIGTALAFGLGGCGGGGNGQPLGERVIPLGQPVPKGGGRYQIGEPYQVAGLIYTPREDPAYDRVGSASWYGELFHGRRTANGEIYDMDRLSAAHPTLPLPVYARVTNLNNGRSLVVRINDRGPFARDRVIDLSRRSAELLGFRNQGTATVRVKYLGRAPMNGDDSYELSYLASQNWARVAARKKTAPHTASIAALSKERSAAKKTENPALALNAAKQQPAAALAPQVTGTIAASAKTALNAQGLMVQAGTFKNKDNAERARATLSAIAPVDVASITMREELYFSVRVGPFSGPTEAKAALAKVTKAGYHGAKVVAQN